MEPIESKVAFIIAHKYVKGYESYIEYYIDNILKFYINPLIIVVDNNSEFADEIFSMLNIKNVILLNNDIEAKFELGAYQVAIEYLIKNQLLADYNYCVFTQDTFVIKNKYDFNILKENKVTACQITSWTNDWAKMDVAGPMLNKLGLTDRLNETRLCWCNSFVLSTEKIIELNHYLKQIIITTRHQSEAAERYLGRIIYELNDFKLFDIDGDIDKLSYYCHTVKITDNISNYFCKISQQKNEKTITK